MTNADRTNIEKISKEIPIEWFSPYAFAKSPINQERNAPTPNQANKQPISTNEFSFEPLAATFLVLATWLVWVSKSGEHNALCIGNKKQL